jgi:DNA-binding CsgD family transcriptional regulator
MRSDFSIEAPHVMEALNDDSAVEILRQLQVRSAALGLSELAELVSQPAELVRARLDLLCAAQLVKLVRAGRGHRWIRYAAAPPPIRIRYSGFVAEHAQQVREYTQRVHARVEQRIERIGIADACDRVQWSHQSLHAPVISIEERDELIERIQRVVDLLKILESRTAKRIPAHQLDAVPCQDTRQHVVEVRVRPLRGVLPPELDVEFITNEAQSLKAFTPRGPAAALPPREQQVARALAEGLGRPQIAAMLGISPHTVVTISARIYRKLGVRSRAQLAVAILGAPPGHDAKAESSGK